MLKLKYLEKNLPSAILYSTNLTRTGLELRPALCGERPENDHLIHATVSLLR